MNRESVDNRLEKFCVEIERLRSMRPSRRVSYPAAIREEARALLAAGIKMSELKRRSGITADAVLRYRRNASESKFQKLAVVKSRSAGPELYFESAVGMGSAGFKYSGASRAF